MAKRALVFCVLLLIGATVVACGGMTGAWGAVGPSNGEVIVSLAADPHDAQLLYAGGSDGHIYRVSTGEPATFTAGQGLPAHDVVNVLLPDPGVPGRVLAATTTGVLLSNDSGRHWTAYGIGLPAKDSIEAIAYGASTTSLYAGTEAHGAYSSQDGGKTWQSSASGLPPSADIYTLFWSASAQTVFAGVIGHGVYSLQDGQQMWQASAQGMPAQSDVFAFAQLPGASGHLGALFAGTSAGLFESGDGGHTWSAPVAGSGLPGGRVLSLATQPGTPDALFAGTDSTVYQSGDSGRHWGIYAPGLSGHVAAIVVLPPKAGAPPVLFAAAGPVMRSPSPAPGPSVGTLIFAAVLLLLLFFWLRRRQGIYRDLLRRQEQARDRNRQAPAGDGT